MDRRGFTHVVALIALTVAWWIPQRHGPIDARFDGATYYVLGTSLAEGRGYRILSEPGAILDGLQAEAGGGEGDIRRCLTHGVELGTRYGVKVVPNGQGNCDGDCAYNRYTLNVQLATSS